MEMAQLLLAIFVLGSGCVQSFSSIEYAGHRCGISSSKIPKNLSVAFLAGDDSKIDWNPEKRPKIAKLPSYSDNWLLNFHNWDQSEKQLVTNSLTVWNEEIRDQQATIIEWQDSFLRNDLADFTPPMSNGLNCLMVGDDFDVVNVNVNDNDDGSWCVKLPWEEESEAQITSLRILEESVLDVVKEDLDNEVIVTEKQKFSVTIIGKEDDDDDDNESVITINNNIDQNEDEEESASGTSMAAEITSERSVGMNGGMVRTELVSHPSVATTTTQSDSSSAIRVQVPNQEVATYDCIVDQGLMDRILILENSHETVRELLEEAAVAIKEFGIYVLVTKELTVDSRKTLEQFGVKVGLEWQFELDGISDDGQVVSVARRFCTGPMPEVWRLSRYQP